MENSHVLPVQGVSSTVVNEYLNEYIKNCITKIDNRIVFSNEKKNCLLFILRFGFGCFFFQDNDYLQLVNTVNRSLVNHWPNSNNDSTCVCSTLRSGLFCLIRSSKTGVLETIQGILGSSEIPSLQ